MRLYKSFPPHCDIMSCDTYPLTARSFLFQKFICSTVRPTYLPYKELYNFDTCAAFVADYLSYKPLKVPNELVCAPLKPCFQAVWEEECTSWEQG